MAFNWGLAFAIGNAAHGIRKGIMGSRTSRNAGSAALVDPTQAAMVNLMHRERRAIETGTSDSYARGQLAKEGKNIIRRGILGGKRDISQYSQLRAQNERAIAEGRANERLGILQNLTEETRNMADRSMDLVELAGDRQRLEGVSKQNTNQRNVMSQLPALQKALNKASQKREANLNEENKKPQNKKNNEAATGVIKTVGKAAKSIFGGGGGGSSVSDGASGGGSFSSGGGGLSDALGGGTSSMGSMGSGN